MTPILQILGALVVSGGAAWFWRWVNNRDKQQAATDTKQDQAKDQADLDKKVKDISDDAVDSEDVVRKRIQELLNKGKTP